ncbi:MAG: hypothetical protein D3924_20340, partial [Candidatus Electrothrix sp. AR4]|nr:hypothetical protein [Candidatus Electrothrix sp. AR4]
MPIPFSQTTRALQADHGRLSRLTLSFAVVILLLWGCWFFYASTYQYVNSKNIYVTQADQPIWKIPKGKNRTAAYERYNVQAFFQPADFRRIKLGQKVRLLLSNSDTLPRRTLAATVSRVDSTLNAVHVPLDIQSDASQLLDGATLERME